MSTESWLLAATLVGGDIITDRDGGGEAVVERVEGEKITIRLSSNGMIATSTRALLECFGWRQTGRHVQDCYVASSPTVSMLITAEEAETLRAAGAKEIAQR